MLMGPITSAVNIIANKDFYEQNSSNNEDIIDPGLEHTQIFRLVLNMFPDLQKNISIRLSHLKLFLRVDILSNLLEFITKALPNYHEMYELPAKFDADPGNMAR